MRGRNKKSVEEMVIELAELIANEFRYMGSSEFDTIKLDGTPRKLMDVSKSTNLGWQASISLEEGITKVYEEIKDCDWSI
jgi:GDP-L-fucose synthase